VRDRVELVGRDARADAAPTVCRISAAALPATRIFSIVSGSFGRPVSRC
jgi:hypothetical protein